MQTLQTGGPQPSRRGAAAWLLLALVAVLVVGTAVVAPAQAAPPRNDAIRDAVVIRSAGRFVVGSGDATSSPSDGRCVEGASVWFRFRPSRTVRLNVVTVGSRYDSVLAVFRGGRANRTLVACNDDGAGDAGAVRERFRAGRQYWIAVSACCNRRASGGRTVLTLYPPRAAGVVTTIDEVETGAVSGRLFVRGTTTCSTPSYLLMELFVSQRVGDAVARGGGLFERRRCGGNGTSWRVAVDTETGWAFQAGSLSLTTWSTALDGFATRTRERTVTVNVRSVPGRT